MLKWKSADINTLVGLAAHLKDGGDRWASDYPRNPANSHEQNAQAPGI